MLLHAYLAQQCATHSIRRGHIPALLRLTNANKALRRYDALLAGGLDDADLLARIRACPPLAGDSLDVAIADTRRACEVNRREAELARELKRRAAFQPHLWVVHERSRPSPIFVVAMYGIDVFKRVDLPQEIARMSHAGARLVAIASMLRSGLQQQDYFCSPFGRPVQVLYRDTYVHSYVFDVESQRFTHELHAPPPLGSARLTIGNASLLIPIRKVL